MITGNAKKQKDPVCGMDVDLKQASFKTEHHQKQYAFCCQQCMDTFKKDPKKFTKDSH